MATAIVSPPTWCSSGRNRLRAPGHEDKRAPRHARLGRWILQVRPDHAAIAATFSTTSSSWTTSMKISLPGAPTSSSTTRGLCGQRVPAPVRATPPSPVLARCSASSTARTLGRTKGIVPLFAALWKSRARFHARKDTVSVRCTANRKCNNSPAIISQIVPPMSTRFPSS